MKNEEQQEKIYIRLRDSFSDRAGIRKVDDTIQIKEFSDETRIRLYNFINVLFDNFKFFLDFDDYRANNYLAERLSMDILNIPLDSPNSRYKEVMKIVKDLFIKGTYDQILSFIEYTVSILFEEYIKETVKQNHGDKIKFDAHEMFNKLFESENIGYRFVNKLIVGITNEKEINAIREASNTAYLNATEHIRNAVVYLSETGERNYKKVISESLMALEALFANFTEDPKADTLTKMINVIEQKKKIHGALIEAIKRLYGFASDEIGVRHSGIKESNDVGFDEAKLVLVICSSLMNYSIPLLE
ncbi:MAG TPA: hypothetical protein PLH82_00035 [Candidatus Paceibacterota bacterium]|nr:hypothetical protein [Candidatus Paceibacterota bacterium]